MRINKNELLLCNSYLLKSINVFLQNFAYQFVLWPFPVRCQWKAPLVGGWRCFEGTRRPWSVPAVPPYLELSVAVLASKRDQQRGRRAAGSSSRVMEGKHWSHSNGRQQPLEGSHDRGWYACRWLADSAVAGVWVRVRAIRNYATQFTTWSTEVNSLCSGMPGRAIHRASSPNFSRAHVIIGESAKKFKMSEELPILKGILNGVVNYHNARRFYFN